MSLATRLASVPQFANMRALLDDVDRLERRAELLEDIVDDVYQVWLRAMSRDVKTAPEVIALEFVRIFLDKGIHDRAHRALHTPKQSAERERACITCSAKMSADIFHNDDESWPSGHVKSGLYKEE